MKRAILFAFFAFLSLYTINAQSYPIESMLKSYSGHKDVEITEISSQFLSLYAKSDKNDLLEKIDKLIVLNFYQVTVPGFIKKSLSEIKAIVDRESYSKIISLNNASSDVDIYTKDKDVLIFIMEEKDEGTVIYIKGDIDDQLLKAVMEGEITIK